MTRVTRPIRRITEAQKYSRGRSVNVVVEIPAGGRTIGFRLAKTRRTYYLPTGDCLAMAIRIYQQAEKARRKAEREALRKGK